MIVIFGTICLDRVRRVPFLPSKGHYVEITDQQVFVGGEAANTSYALLKWGEPFELFGNILGEGEDADLILDLAREKGLPTDNLRKGPVQPPVCDIYVTPDGERTMFGAGFTKCAEATDPLSVGYREGSWFTTDPNLVDTARNAINLARDASMKLYLMDFVDLKDPIYEGSFWQSSTDWAGFPGNTQKNVEWVRDWVSRFGCFAVLSDGPNGFVAGSPTLKTRAYPPFPCPSLVDFTGAGDIFRAGMILGLDRGWEIPKCLQFASAAGCLECGTFGANSFVPSEEEIWAHVQAYPEVGERYY